MHAVFVRLVSKEDVIPKHGPPRKVTNEKLVNQILRLLNPDPRWNQQPRIPTRSFSASYSARRIDSGAGVLGIVIPRVAGIQRVHCSVVMPPIHVLSIFKVRNLTVNLFDIGMENGAWSWLCVKRSDRLFVLRL
jgi:hypothetical protein